MPDMIKIENDKWIPAAILSLSLILCLLIITYLESNRRISVNICNKRPAVAEKVFEPLQNPDRFTSAEIRVARQFESDTLPGLIRHGLIKKFERRQSGTLMLVEGKIWIKRSPFFKDSLLKAVSVYNKVNDFSPVIKIADYRTSVIYAQAFSDDQREIFN